MAAGSEALVLKVSADTQAVADGLDPMVKALDDLSDEAAKTDKELKQLSKLDASPDIDGIEKMIHSLDELEDEIDDTRDAMKDLSKTEITLSMKEQAIDKARKRIEELRDQIAEDVVLGVSTKDAEREISNLEKSVKKLTDTPAVVPIDVDVDEEEVRGVESLREGALGLSEAVGAANGSLTGFAQIGRELVPALADMNDAMVQMGEKAAASGGSMGRLGRATSAVTSLMAGPWGLAVAAGVGLMSAFASQSDEAKDAAKSFAESIDFSTGALDRNNRELVAQKLAEMDTLDEAERLGVSTQDLVSALIEGGEASRLMRERLEVMFDNAPMFSKTANDARDLLEGFKQNAAILDVARATAAKTGRAIGDLGDEAESTANQLNTDSWKQYDSAVDDARKAVDDIIGSLDILNGRFATARQAQSDYAQGQADIAAALKENTKTLNLSSEAGRKNDAIVREQADNIANLADARLRDADTTGETTAQILGDYKKQRDSLVSTMMQFGLSKKEAEKYVNQLLATPEEVKTKATVTGLDQANSQLNNLAKDRTAEIHAELTVNTDKFERDLRRKTRTALAEAGITGDLSSRSVPQSAPAPTVFMQPRIFLDSVPIRSALRGDIQTTVDTAIAATSQRGRM